MSYAGWRRRVIGMVAAGVLVGCAAGPPLEGGVYVVRSKGYRIVPPTGWERIDSGADLALRHRQHAAGLMVHGSCEGKTAERPLPVLARHLRFGLREVEGLNEAPAELSGQRGVRSRFTARLDGVPVAVDAVTVRARGCVYDLVAIAPPGRLEAVAPDFERFTASFRLAETTP